MGEFGPHEVTTKRAGTAVERKIITRSSKNQGGTRPIKSLAEILSCLASMREARPQHGGCERRREHRDDDHRDFDRRLATRKIERHGLEQRENGVERDGAGEHGAKTGVPTLAQSIERDADDGVER